MRSVVELAARCRLLPCCAVLLVSATGCYDMPRVDPGLDDVELVADERGFILPNDFGVKGQWYAYGDRYGAGGRNGMPGETEPGTCTSEGLHDVDDCSLIESPSPIDKFESEEGRFCTEGSTAVVPLCKRDVACDADGYDYSNVWGAGIGLNLSHEIGQDKKEWDPELYGVIGVSFQITSTKPIAMRVEFPIALPDGSAEPTTETHRAGSPYWGANGTYPNSDVVAGTNRVFWDQVASPQPDEYTFDRTRLIAIQFHVPSVRKPEVERREFDFCISNLRLLR